MQPAHDTARVVAHVLVSHGSRIGAVINLAVRDSRNAACVRVCGHVGGAVDLLHIFHGKILQIQRDLRAVCINITLVAAIIEHAVILAHDAAHRMVADHGGVILAPPDLSRLFVDTCDTAHLTVACDLPRKAAILDLSVIDADNTARAAGSSARCDLSRHRKVDYAAALLHVTEQSCGGAVGGDAHLGKAVSVSVKYAGKGRNAQLLPDADIILLAQASMANFRQALHEALGCGVTLLESPSTCAQYLKTELGC